MYLVVGQSLGTLAGEGQQAHESLLAVFLPGLQFDPAPGMGQGQLVGAAPLVDGSEPIQSFDDLSGSVTDDTPLRFDPAEKRQIENLQKLFSITVEFPWLLPLVRRAVRLPPNRLFWLVYKLWKGYALKQRIFAYRMSAREMFVNLLSYMRISTQ